MIILFILCIFLCNCTRMDANNILFCEAINFDLQGQIVVKRQDWTHFELVHTITPHQLKSVIRKLDQKCMLALFRSLLIYGFQRPHPSISLLSLKSSFVPTWGKMLFVSYQNAGILVALIFIVQVKSEQLKCLRSEDTRLRNRYYRWHYISIINVDFLHRWATVLEMQRNHKYLHECTW